MKLRAWQSEAIAKYESEHPLDFLVTATPGAGKTTFALALAARLKRARVVDRIIVVAPTDHLRTQWADAAVRMGMMLDPNLPNASGAVREGADGYVTTYAQVAARPLVHRYRTERVRSLVILDEIHHAGDALSWGEAVDEAFDPAKRRLCLTGTPFRTNPNERIPFVRYRAAGAGEAISEADYTYGYREALSDRVVRPVVFAAYRGVSRWMNSAGEVLAAELGEDSTRAIEDAAWRTALDPDGAWVPHVIAAIDDRVSHKRMHGMPDAAGLILASDQESARAYADIAKRITGEEPVLILSDDPKASKKIEEFDKGQQRLAICVRMVTEGVDVPRAAVLGFLTSYRTPLFFAQAVGRVVRARSSSETATVFLPAVRPLLALAAALEEQRDHVVRVATSGSDDLDALIALDEQIAPEDRLKDGAGEFRAIEAEATFGHVLHGGRAITPVPVADDDEEYLGLPGLLTPEQTAMLLAARDAEVRKRTSPIAVEEKRDEPPAPGSWREVDAVRKDINRLVSQIAASSGRPHASIHVEARKAVPGPPSSAASIEVLAERRSYLLTRAR